MQVPTQDMPIEMADEYQEDDTYASKKKAVSESPESFYFENLAEGMKAEIIICNFAQAIFNNKTIIESPVPIMFVEHCIYPITHVIYRWNQAIDKGHSMFLVSKWQEKKYKEMELFKNLKKEVGPGKWVNRSMTDKELKYLQKLDAEKAELRKFLTKQDAQLEGAATGAIRTPIGEKVDFFPYLRRTGGVPGYDMLAIKTMVDDAIRSGQRGVTIVPAGVGNRSSDAGMYLFYGDSRGTKIKGLKTKALPGGKKKKVSPDAIYVDALRKIAKQIEKEHGIKLKVVQREIFNYDPMKLYAIENKSGQVIASFKTRQNRDFVLAKKNEMSPSGEGFNAINFGEGAPGSPEMRKGSFKSIVLEIPDSAAKTLSKKKMSTYREGGLVAITPKREYFAAVI